jgi:uncharacterized membrane protein
LTPPLAGDDDSSALTRAPGDRRSPKWYVAGCAGLVALALVLRFIHLGSQSFWIDEISVTSFVRSGHIFSDLRNRGGPFEPPLHYLAVLAAIQLPIGFETAARIPSALFGGVEVLALILAAYEATRRHVTALLAGALLTVSPFVVRYSQENRYYVMFSALALLTWWLLLCALRLRRTSAWVWYGVVAAAMQLTHPFAPLVLLLEAAVVGFVAWRERREERGRVLARGYLLAAAVGIVLILPWYLYGIWRWIPDSSKGKSYDLNPPGALSVRVEPELFKRGAEWLFGDSVSLTVLVALLVIAMFAAPLVTRGRDRVVAGLVLGYVVIFTIALLRLAVVLVTYFAFRRVESLVAPMLLLVAITIVAGVDRLRGFRLDKRIAYGIGGVVTALILVLSLAATINYYGTQKSNYRGLARGVQDAPRDASVVIGPVDKRWPRLIRDYLDWQGVHRPVTFIVANRPPPSIPLQAGGVRWFSGTAPFRPDIKVHDLNDLRKMQVIAGDRSVILAILPWFESTSMPRTQAELDDQRDAVARLAPFMAALP